VVGPAPGSLTPGTARTTGSTGGTPTEPVAGIGPALEGGSFWIMDTARTAAGDCQLHLVTPGGPVDDAGELSSIGGSLLDASNRQVVRWSHDTATGALYQSSVELMPGRLDFVALPAPLR